MRVVATEEARELIHARGGSLYVWLKSGRCCGNVTTLATATEQPDERTFRRVESEAPFDLFLPAALGRLPDELHVELSRRRHRVAAYWNGCAWVV